MANRLELHEILCNILGSRNVYYQPPNGLKMSFPAITYSLNNIESNYANDKRYINNNRYEIIVIDYDQESAITDKVMELPFTTLGRQYISDNLYHDPITLYY